MNAKDKIKNIITSKQGEVIIGKVLWYSECEGRGIIIEESEGHEVYFDKSVIVNGKIRKGERVKFYYNEKFHNFLCAKGVKEI